MTLSYGRQIKPALEKAVGPGGVAHSLVTRQLADPLKVDLHLRGYPGKPLNWVTLYCGLTKPLDLVEYRGHFRIRAHPTWMAYASDLPWKDRLDLSHLGRIWPEVDAYLDVVLPVIQASRWFGKEGAVQTAVTRLRQDGLTVFDREACPSFHDTAEKQLAMGAEQQLLTAELVGTEAWWTLPRLGEECDALALDGQGRLLAIEVKPATASARSIAFSPLQASYYARLFERWARQEQADPEAAVNDVIAQRARLGLAEAGARAVSPLPVIPTVILGGGMPSKEVLRRCLVVREAILRAGLIKELQLWSLDADGELVAIDTRGPVGPPQYGRRTMSFTSQERVRAAAWKATTATLPDAAREPAPYLGKTGRPSSRSYDFCLPASYAAWSLLPEVRDSALHLFRELGIPWHAGVDGGPSNHLLSSQVQCVNALGQMVADPGRLARAFGEVVDIDEVLEIEPGRFLTFEYIGPTDYFGEAPRGARTRGANCTSVDAAFRHRAKDGQVELVLVEWKYTESYGLRSPSPRKDEVRRGRYASFVDDPDGPIRADILSFDDLLDEPFYQLVRQQLLASQLEKAGAAGATRVRLIHVSPKANLAYQQSLPREQHRALGSSVSEVWQRLLRRQDRFASLDSSVFLHPAITSDEYVSRYGGNT